MSFRQVHFLKAKLAFFPFCCKINEQFRTHVTALDTYCTLYNLNQNFVVINNQIAFWKLYVKAIQFRFIDRVEVRISCLVYIIKRLFTWGIWIRDCTPRPPPIFNIFVGALTFHRPLDKHLYTM